MANFDVTGVVTEFLRGKIPERKNLVHEITDAMRGNPAIFGLIAEVGHNCVEHNHTAVQTINLGLMYGMVLGILLERERAERQKPN